MDAFFYFICVNGFPENEITPEKFLKNKKRTENQCVLKWVNDGSRTHDLRNHNPAL